MDMKGEAMGNDEQKKPVGFYTGAITLPQVRAAKPKMIYYSVGTCWWTHDENHLCRHLGMGLPCDPRGSVLMETDKPERFLTTAQENAEHYGKHGMEAFMASHHLNCVVSAEDRRSTCFTSWSEYNRIVDEAIARAQEARHGQN